MIIIGIDPGYARTGFGVIDYTSGRFTTLDYGLITTRADCPFEQRLLTIASDLERILSLHAPEVMAVEELFFSKNTTTAFGAAHARGVILLSGARRGIHVYEHTPIQVKQAVTGYGRADKAQVTQMVRTLLCIKDAIKIDDIADALAVAICQAHAGMRVANRAVAGYHKPVDKRTVRPHRPS